MHYDQIFVLDKGIVAEKGSPRELLRANGLFREMVGNMFQQLNQMLESEED